ncbi:MAG: NADP-dependent isocitrate dehydrogenase [Rickettsiales bacterium]
MAETTPITVVNGDGIGPEIMDATLKILLKSGARISVETGMVGEEVYKRGNTSGITSQTWESFHRTKVMLKAPITTPQGGGYKSVNVTIRKALGLYANVRPSKSLHPYVKTNFPDMDLVIIRENEEDLYAGIEYRQTCNMYQSLKLLTATGTEKICRYAFEYAVKNNRKKVTCMTKDNIMKIADGMFHRVFDKVAKEYPDIENEHYIIDIGAARLANRPEDFDVVVTENLYGDVISDITAEVCGSVGMAGSANIGDEYAMFEAIHGSAPKMAGNNTANPSGLLNGAIMMLVHIGQADIANKVRDAWLTTLEDGIHTKDIFEDGKSSKKVGTQEFADAVIDRLGKKPKKFAASQFKNIKSTKAKDLNPITKEKKQLVGVDVFIDWYKDHGDVQIIGEKLQDIARGELQLQMISSRGLKVFPGKDLPKPHGDHWRCRFVPANNEKKTTHAEVVKLLQILNEAKLDFIKTEHLYSFDDKLGFSLGQGE